MLTAFADGASPAARSVAPEQPLSIGNIFGWLKPGQTRRGVILCGTLGYEHHCAHRPWRELARRIASTGCTTIRFDYPGSGDSGDVSIDDVQVWTQAIGQIARYLRDVAAVEEVVLVGFRFGGTLAVLAAECERVDRLVLLAPFVTGKAFIRETTLQARVIDVRPDGSPMPAAAGVVSAGGFALSPTVLSEIARIDLTRRGRRPAAHILLMGPERGGLAAHYRNLGAAVTTEPFPDLAQLCAKALDSRFSEATLAAVVEHASGDLPHPRSIFPWSRPVPAVTIEGSHWTEEPVRFGPGLIGIQCQPSATPRDTTVLFLNMGLDVHSGPGRQTTELARRLAGAGLRSLRMDLRGAGDSPDRSDGRRPLYDLVALDDVQAAVDHLVQRWAGPVIVAGTCNGAYLAFHAVCRDRRIHGAVMVNLYCFDWDLAHGGIPYSAATTRSIASYLSLARHGTAWQRVFRGRTPVLKIAHGLSRRLLGGTWRRLKDPFVVAKATSHLSESIAATVRGRGAQLALLYSAGDLGLADLHARFGRAPSRLQRTFGRRVRIVPDTDHAFTAPLARDALYDALMDVSASASPHHTWKG